MSSNLLKTKVEVLYVQGLQCIFLVNRFFSIFYLFRYIVMVSGRIETWPGGMNTRVPSNVSLSQVGFRMLSRCFGRMVTMRRRAIPIWTWCESKTAQSQRRRQDSASASEAFRGLRRSDLSRTRVDSSGIHMIDSCCAFEDASKAHSIHGDGRVHHGPRLRCRK